MTAPDTAIVPDAAAFLTAVRQSGVLTPEQFHQALETIPKSANSTVIADFFVKSQLLTPFQADQLLRKRSTSLLLGQYVILEEIGRSSGGRIFKARHRTMGRYAAIKILSSRLTRAAETYEILQAETRLAAQLIHPNIVAVLDFNRVGDRWYLIREYVEGVSADHLVQEQGPLPVRQACEIIRQAALGLHYAHEKGQSHGGLTPAELLILQLPTGRMEVKVANFGLGRMTGLIAVDQPANPLSDPADYLAPEQFQNPGSSSPAADLYALGCILYFLLTGRPPYSANSLADKAKAHLFSSPIPLAILRPDTPIVLAALLDVLLSKNPAARFPTAADLANHLTPFAEMDQGLFPSPLSGIHPRTEQGTLAATVTVPAMDASPWTDLSGDSGVASAVAAALKTPVSLRKIVKSPSRSALRHQRRGLAWWLGFAVLVVSAIVALLVWWWLRRYV